MENIILMLLLVVCFLGTIIALKKHFKEEKSLRRKKEGRIKEGGSE